MSKNTGKKYPKTTSLHSNHLFTANAMTESGKTQNLISPKHMHIQQSVKEHFLNKLDLNILGRRQERDTGETHGQSCGPESVETY